MNYKPLTMNSKKYTLKPGKHQFAPGSPAEHDNDNSSDEEIAWYLKAYPHIATLLEKSPEVGKTESPEEAPNKMSKAKRMRIISKSTPANH